VANHVEVLRPGGPAAPSRAGLLVRTGLRRRRLADTVARRVVTLGGLTIIGSILAILAVIALEVAPLFAPPHVKPVQTLAGPVTVKLPGPAMALAVDDYREIAYAVTAAGLQVFRVGDGTLLPAPALPGLDGATVTSVAAPARGGVTLGLSSGRVVTADVRFTTSFEQRRRVDAEVVPGPLMTLAAGRPVRAVTQAVTPAGPLTAAAVGPAEVLLVRVRERKALIGPPTREETRDSLALPTRGDVTALLADGRGEDLFVGASDGQLMRVDLRETGAPRVAETIPSARGTGGAVTVLGFLEGDRTLVVGDAAGGVSSWQLVRAEAGQRLRRIHDFAPHEAPVIAFAASRRDKGFVTADRAGVLRLHYGTTGATLLTWRGEGGGTPALAFAPKADALLTVDAAGRLAHWQVDNPHPEVTWRSVFGKLWYEGYDAPDHVWQSTGGTDDFEAKLSLTPLVYGTLKGTVYALLFAVPLALLAALYTSQFMHPSLRAAIKPTVELMAALPSVVLGFVAGLWLAPMLERYVPGLFLVPAVVMAVVLGAAAAWQLVPGRLRPRAGAEVFLLVPVVVGAGWLALALGGWVESAWLGGDYRTWLREALGLTYDQRNSLVVGFAMGFAVVPIIFTIAEDSLSSVPPHLVAGSLALGATRWQTALRTVLPTASPGIFSAVMIGFGRAVGETMIVLMATGNTALMDWSPFNGFRALSANIAVELPEAPEGGTLYRLLFLAALLLFAMTFVLNTAAEMVRLRLRRKYRDL
jgi:phosphate transport system permease protein